MILEFDDACWNEESIDWKRGLLELLALLANRNQHSLLARREPMLSWCESHMPSHVDYFKARLAAAQLRTNALRILISVAGADDVNSDPPWNLNVRSAYKLVNEPLRVVLENDQSDRSFVESTIPSFASWCSKGWVQPVMGGGSVMKKKISITNSDSMARWRTFYLFDSDRLHPSELATGWTPPRGDGCQGHVFQSECGGMPAGRWHMLGRRSIENYLPEPLLMARNPAVTTALFNAAVGSMAEFYNYKKGLAGDGVHPIVANQAIRAKRSQGFWVALPPPLPDELKHGYGNDVAEEFANVPPNHTWPLTILTEMDQLSETLQDAI